MIDNTNGLEGRILGTCMLQGLIGQGGMSAVYRAQQLHPARQIAVKILVPNVPIGSQLHQQFLMYNGYYIVEKENGIWKLDPHFFGQ